MKPDILPNITLILNKNQTRIYETDIDFLFKMLNFDDDDISRIENTVQTISTPCLFIIPIFFLIIIMFNFLFCIFDWYKKLWGVELLENNINIIGQQVNSMEPMANMDSKFSNQADSITNNTLDKTTDTINLKEKADDKAIENN